MARTYHHHVSKRSPCLVFISWSVILTYISRLVVWGFTSLQYISSCQDKDQLISIISWRWYNWNYMRMRKLEPTLLPTQGSFNLPHHISMAWEELAFDDTRLYIMGKWIAAHVNVIAVTRIRTPVLSVTYPTLNPTEPTPHPGTTLRQCTLMDAL